MGYKFETTVERSKIMKKIKSTNTLTEKILAKALWSKGIRYRKNYSQLPGKPDIAITKYKIAVFVDGELWHGYNWNEKKNKIRSNRDYWIKKIERNMERDRKNNLLLEELGWVVIRFWEREIKKDLDGCINKIQEEIQNRTVENI